MSSTMSFGLIGDDRLSPVMNHAGDMAVDMAGRVTLAATETDLAMNDLTRDLEYRIRDAQGRVIPESTALGRTIGTYVNRGADELLSSLHPTLQVDADSRPADADVMALFRRIEGLRDARIGVDIPVDTAIGEVDSIRTALQSLSAHHADPEIRANADSALTTISDVRAQITRLDEGRATVDVDIDAARAIMEAEEAEHAVDAIGDNDGPDRAGRRFGLLGSVIGGVGSVLTGLGSKAAPLAMIGAQAGYAIPIVASLAGTVANILPASAIAVTGIFMVVSATAALKLGMSGVGDAVKVAFDPGAKAGALEAALKNLAPEARSFVLALRDLRPDLDNLKFDTQAALFKGFGDSVTELAHDALPLLDHQLTDSAGALNAMGRGVIDTAESLVDDGTFGKALKGANRGLWNLSGIPAQIVNGLVEIGAAAAPAFGRVTSGVAGVIDKVSNKLDHAFESGAMEKSIDTAIDVIKSIGATVGDVFTIVRNVMSQAGAAGSDAFGTVKLVAQTLAHVTGLPEVQSAIRSVFQVMGEVGKVAAPLLTSALRLLAPVITTLAPPALRLVDTLGAALQPIIVALGPVLVAAAGAVGQLTDAAGPLLVVAGSMIASLGPLLTPVLLLVGQAFGYLAPLVSRLGQSLLPPFAKIVKTAGTAFGEMAPVLDTALQQLGDQGLTPIITGLTDVVAKLVTSYADEFLDMFEQLLPVVPVLIPILLQLGKSVGLILESAAPLIPQIMLLGAQLISNLLPAVLPLLPPLVQLELILLRLATGAITKVAIPAIGALVTVAHGLQRGMQPMIDAVTWVTTKTASAFQWVHDKVSGQTVPDMVNVTVGILQRLPGRAASAIASLPGRVGDFATTAGNRLISGVRHGADGAVSVARGIPGQVKDALGNVDDILYRSGQALIRGFASGIRSMIQAAGDAAGAVLGKVKGFFPNSPAKEGPFSGSGWTLYSGQAVVDDWAGGMLARRGHLVDTVGDLAAAASGALVPGDMAMAAAAPGAPAATGGGRSFGPISITVPGLGGIVLAKELQRAFLELKRTSGLNISLEIA